MSGALATIAAAAIGSLPGWATVYVTNRRALGRQTEQLRQATDAQTSELKAHFGETAADGTVPPPQT